MVVALPDDEVEVGHSSVEQLAALADQYFHCPVLERFIAVKVWPLHGDQRFPAAIAVWQRPAPGAQHELAVHGMWGTSSLYPQGRDAAFSPLADQPWPQVLSMAEHVPAEQQVVTIPATANLPIFHLNLLTLRASVGQ